jgi:hypothetical protein
LPERFFSFGCASNYCVGGCEVWIAEAFSTDNFQVVLGFSRFGPPGRAPQTESGMMIGFIRLCLPP